MATPLSLSIRCEEAWSVLYHVLPQTVHWCYRRFLTGSIQPESLGSSTLYCHTASKTSDSAALLIPGDHAPTSTMLHVADALAPHCCVYSLYIPDINDPTQHEAHLKMVKAAIEKIGCPVFGVGHSKGGIYLAAMKKSLSGAVVIGSRVQVDESCGEDLKPLVQKIDLKSQKLMKVISPSRDWCASQEAMNLGERTVVVDGSHLSGLYCDKTVAKVTQLFCLHLASCAEKASQSHSYPFY